MKSKRARLMAFLTAVLAGLAIGQTVKADGGYFTDKTVTTNLATSADQVAVIVQTGNTVSMTFSTGYTGGGDDFAWVIPVPAAITAGDVAEVTDAPIDALDQLSAPIIHDFYLNDSTAGGCDCGGGSAEDGWDEEKSALVTVVARITTTTYEINVLAVPDLPALVTWLDTNNYSVSADAQTVLGTYITANPSYFAAIKLVPSAVRQYTNEFLPPVCVKYQSPDLSFPLHVSQVSAGATARIKLMIVATSTVSSPNYTTANLVYLTQPGYLASVPNYITKCIQNTIAGNPRGLARIFAGPLPDFSALTAIAGRGPLVGEAYFLTRLETLVAPAAMTLDVDLAPDAQNKSFRVDIYQYHNSYSAGLGASLPSAFLVLGLISAGYALARRRARGPS